jgi:hypothetical protein
MSRSPSRRRAWVAAVIPPASPPITTSRCPIPERYFRFPAAQQVAVLEARICSWRDTGTPPEQVSTPRSRTGPGSLDRRPYGAWPPSSSGLGRQPFKLVTRVRIPLGVRRRHPCSVTGSADRPAGPSRTRSSHAPGQTRRTSRLRHSVNQVGSDGWRSMASTPTTARPGLLTACR